QAHGWDHSRAGRPEPIAAAAASITRADAYRPRAIRLVSEGYGRRGRSLWRTGGTEPLLSAHLPRGRQRAQLHPRRAAARPLPASGKRPYPFAAALLRRPTIRGPPAPRPPDSAGPVALCVYPARLQPAGRGR